MAVYRHDYAAFGKNVLCAPWMVAEMRARAERAKAFAESISPYYAADADGHHYRDDFEVEAGVRVEGTARAYATLSNTNSAAVIVEFGFGPGVDKDGNPYPEQRGHRVLGKAMEVMR